MQRPSAPDAAAGMVRGQRKNLVQKVGDWLRRAA
jgi:hypothetical protein